MVLTIKSFYSPNLYHIILSHMTLVFIYLLPWWYPPEFIYLLGFDLIILTWFEKFLLTKINIT